LFLLIYHHQKPHDDKSEKTGSRAERNSAGTDSILLLSGYIIVRLKSLIMCEAIKLALKNPDLI
jgi:hypothetical protein